MSIDLETYICYKNQPISCDEDEWNGKYKTWGEMWDKEGYRITDDGYYC